MTTPIKIKRSGTASSTPSSLDHGELALNYADDTLFWKDDANVIQSFVFQAYASATHKSTHATGGSDALSPSDIGAAPAASPEFTGFVGINANPSTRRLTVRGSSTADGALLLQSSSTGTGTNNGFIIQCFGAASDAYVWNFENAPIIFGANNAERMRLYADGKLDVTNSVWAVNGSAGSPGFTFRNDTNTGIFQASGSADTLSISTAGVERVRVDSSGGVTITNTGTGNSFVVNDGAGDTTPFVVDADGKCGIRGATPSSLHSLFNTLCVGTGGAAAQGITIFSQSVCTLAFGDTAAGDTADSARGYVAYTHTTDTLTIGTNSATRITVDSTGKVGVNRSSPASTLDVNGVLTVSATSGSAGDYAPSLTFSGDANTGFGQVSGQSDTASIFTAGYERVRVTSSGTVGIGTSSIDSGVTLDTRGTIQAKAAGVKIQAVDSSVIVKTQASNATSEGIVGTESNHNLAIRANNVAALRVKTTGAVRFVPLSADPASGDAGDVYYNSSTNKLRVYNGTSWVDLH